jgi:hypothetical protein
MSPQALIDTARALVAGDKGLLAMDESNPTCNKRFARLGIPQTEEARRAYRELIMTTPGLGECISGAILYDETIRQQKQVATALGTGVFVCPRHPATGFGDLAWRGGPRAGGTASSGSSSQVQQCCLPWRIHCRDGKDVSMTTRILQLTKPAA